MYRVKYAETLCGLLHDIGKPFLRYKQRADENIEDKDYSLLSTISNLETHEEIGVKVVRDATEGAIDLSLCVLFKQAIPYADAVAATERGLGGYPWLVGIWKQIERSVSSNLGIRYGHIYTPLLSPLWIALETDYAKSIGPCAKASYSADKALIMFLQSMKDLAEKLDSGDMNGVLQTITHLLSKLADKPLWLASQPLTTSNILNLKTRNYVEAQRLTSYRDISRLLYDGLKRISQLYGTRLTRGYVDTVNELLKYTLLTVPAAVYLALLPDTSLYSHSKMVAAYTAALSLNTNKFKLLVVDVRGIQSFVTAPVAPKAASRVIRGRSFLVEVLLASLVNYILELYGGLTHANILTSEGGVVSIVVPALNDIKLEEAILETVRNVVRSTYERLKGPWFTIVLSREFDLGDVNFIKNLRECTMTKPLPRCPGFFELLEDLTKMLALEKVRDNARSAMWIEESDIVGFDSITREPVTRKDIEWYGLRVERELEDYTSAISGGKLTVGDIVSEATHLSLVAGTALRNIILLLSVYVYKQPNELKGPLVPAVEEVDDLLSMLRNDISKRFKVGIKPVQLFFSNLEFKGYGFDVALIPLPTLGAIHVMISTRTPAVIPEARATIEAKKAAKDTLLRLEAISAELTALIVDMMAERLRELVENGCLVRVEVRAVNRGVEFIEVLENERFNKVARKLLENGIDLYLGTIHTGTYHPSTLEGLVDLDIYNLIAMVKMDADGLGEVKKLVSFSPTRLSALSDYLTIVINCKTNMLATKVTAEYVETLEPRGPILLYAGGDDVAFYGYWVDVLLFLRKLYEEVVNALYPLSFTSAISIERYDYPLLELYSRVISGLEDGKREARGWVFLADIASERPVVCADGNGKKGATVGMQPLSYGVYEIAPKPLKPLMLLEFYESLAKAIEKLERDPASRAGIAGYKRELMTASRIATLSERELKVLVGELGGIKVQDIEALYSLTKRFVALSYVSARRRDEFEKLANQLSKLVETDPESVRLHHKSGEDILEIIRRAVSSKTFIDVLLLYLNPYSTEIKRRPVA